MKQLLILFSLLIIGQTTLAQDEEFVDDNWLVSLPIAKLRARESNKMILMVWENASKYPLPIVVRSENGKNVFIDNLFAEPKLSELLSQYFILVKVSDEVYAHLFAEIDGKRKQSYIDKFNDDTLKVMDANGNIVGTSGAYTELLNLSKFIFKYGLETSYIKQEITNYQRNKDFYSTFYLASKYIDYSILINDKVRSEILALSDLYFQEARQFLSKGDSKDKNSLSQRLYFTQLKQELVKGKSRKVLRALKKYEAPIEEVNIALVIFLRYTAYRLENDIELFKTLEKEISLLNLKQAQLIVNINR
ncbi:hypothetical protein ACFQ1Q_08855 [Winogradskyella litorisediminis]|uniref:Uncharacterized protein n=1 Tax=Winogradskyella litorisediminis TaxID=1156618 RepID=A0ABW3NAN6_9FLAO